jgi:hypothetical protein
MNTCACQNCPRWQTEEEKADCRKKKLKRQLELPTFDKQAWDRVKAELRPTLAAYIVNGNWEEVATFWRKNRWMVEEAILGK